MCRQKGQSLVEILVSIGMIAIVLSSVVGVFIVTRESSRIGQAASQASYLTSEYFELISNIKRDDWESLQTGRFIIQTSGGSASLVPTTDGETIGTFTRYVDITDAYRDENGALVETGGIIDPSTKMVVVTVSWTGFKEGSVSKTSYITRYRDNLSWIQTSEDDFNAGTHSATAVTNTDGGEVILGSGGYGDWCEPTESVVAELDLPGNGVGQAVDAVEGSAVTGTGQNASGEAYVHIGIDNSSPPNLTIEGTFDGYKTNDVFTDGDYAYIATNNKKKDVVIIDLNTNTEVGYFNGNNGFIFKNMRAKGVYVVGNTGYVTIGTYLQTFDLSSKNGSRPSLDRVFLWGVGNKLQVVGDYAYIAVEYLFSELRLVNVSDPNNLSLGARADVNGERGQEVFVNDTGTRVYLATDESNTLDEFFIIDTDYSSRDKNNSWFYFPIVSSYDANGMDPRGVTVVPGNRALLVGVGGEEYQVIDMSDEANPTRCGGIQVDSGIYGVAAVLETDGDAYSYVVTRDHDNEFKVIEGGPGGEYASSGIFESETLNSNYQSGFNRFEATYDMPIGTDISFQVAVVDTAVGDCTDGDFSDFNFVGPDGTSATFFTEESAIPTDNNGLGFENPGQCLRYRAYFATTDPLATPTLRDVTINYSP